MSSQAPVLAAAGALRARGVGVMFLSFFGSWWMATGVNSVYGMKLSLLTSVGLVGAVLFLAGWRQSSRDEHDTEAALAARSKAFRNVNLLQWGCIVAWLVILNVIQHVEWIVPGIMLIVGLHFFPLARLFKSKGHYLTGAALAILAVSYPLAAAEGPNSAAGPIGAGLILWTRAAFMLIETSRARTQR